MKRLLFVTETFPEDMRTAVYGIYQRMRMFLEAASQVAENLQVLFYVSPAAETSRAAVAAAQAKLLEHWGISADITLCRMGASSSAASSWDFYAAPVFSIHRQAHFRGPYVLWTERC